MTEAGSNCHRSVPWFPCKDMTQKTSSTRISQNLNNLFMLTERIWKPMGNNNMMQLLQMEYLTLTVTFGASLISSLSTRSEEATTQKDGNHLQ